MKLICSTEIKQYNPKPSYRSPMIRLPNGYDPSLIGQPIDVYKIDGGLLIKLKTCEQTDMSNFENSHFKELDNKLESIMGLLRSSSAGIHGFDSHPSHTFLFSFRMHPCVRPGPVTPETSPYRLVKGYTPL